MRDLTQAGRRRHQDAAIPDPAREHLLNSVVNGVIGVARTVERAAAQFRHLR